MTNQLQNTNHLFDHGQAQFNTRHLQENDLKIGFRYLFNRSLAIGVKAGFEDEFYFDVKDNQLVNFKKEKLTYY